MTGDEILGIALEQSAIDSGCRPSDFLSPAGCIVVSRADPRARRYLELPFDCDLTCYGNGIVASVAEPLVEPVRGYIERFPAVHCFETPNLLVLAEALAPFGLRVCFMASYYLPLPGLRPLPCALNVRFLTPPDLAGLYLPQWSNALCEKRRELDVLAAGAYDGDRLVGFSYIECWEHGDYVATSGLIVSPDYRHMGLAARIKEKTFELARRRFPYAKLFSITTSLPVMKLNSRMGYVPVTFSELTEDEEFWRGCEGCCNYDILQRNNRRMCLCTGMLYDPAKEPPAKQSRLAPYRMFFRNKVKKLFHLK